MAGLLWSKMKSAYNMVASKPEYMKLGKDMKKHYTRNTWKDQTCFWQPVEGERGEELLCPSNYSLFKQTILQNACGGGGGFCKKKFNSHVPPLNQIIHET